MLPPWLPGCPFTAEVDAGAPDAVVDATLDDAAEDSTADDADEIIELTAELTTDETEAGADAVVADGADTVSLAMRRTPSTKPWLIKVILSTALNVAGERDNLTKTGPAQPLAKIVVCCGQIDGYSGTFDFPVLDKSDE